MSKHIVITGEGIVAAIGNDKDAVLTSLGHHTTGIGEMRYLNSERHEWPVGEVKLSNDEMKEMAGIEQSELISRTTLMGILSTHQALEDAGIPPRNAPGNKCIVFISGTTVGGMDIAEQFADKIVDKDYARSEYVKYYDIGSSTDRIAQHFGLFAHHTTVSTACSSAANAIILGANMIKAGEADIVVAGGAEALSRLHLNGFNSLMILDKEPCRPFDATRAGLNLGEGAAYIVMESEESAQRRGATVHAYLTGYGNACDAFHQTASSDNGEGAFLAMSQALKMAHLKPSDIQYVNAHGTGTPNNDLTESRALQRVFGNEMPFVSSTKSFTGHTTSASGSIEAVVCLLAMKHQFIPANLGWRNPMEEGILPTMGLDAYKLDNVLSNAFGFGGNDSSLLFSRKPVATDDDADFLKYSDADIRVVSRVEITDEAALNEIRDYISPLEARRMGKLMKASLLTSLKALREAGIETPDAIVTSTAWGCIENTEKLLRQLHDEGETSLKPTYFMQSTHNTISSNVAIRTHCHGYNITYAQGSASLEWALRDACLLLKSGQCSNVLVGYHDERTSASQFHSLSIVMSCGR